MNVCLVHVKRRELVYASPVAQSHSYTAVNKICLKQITLHFRSKFDISVTAYMLELYNERLIDLFAKPGTSSDASIRDLDGG